MTLTEMILDRVLEAAIEECVTAQNNRAEEVPLHLITPIMKQYVGDEFALGDYFFLNFFNMYVSGKFYRNYTDFIADYTKFLSIATSEFLVEKIDSYGKVVTVFYNNGSVEHFMLKVHKSDWTGKVK